MKYQRILLKLTGELFACDHKGIDFEKVEEIAGELKRIVDRTKVEMAIVVGGGNLFRGREAESKVDRATADYIGMQATIMNGLALQEALERLGEDTRVMSSLNIDAVCEPYIRRRAIRHLEKKRIIILAGGLGAPFFTTDTASALRACELKCDVILKASGVDGVYDKDPKTDPDASLYREIGYQEVLEKSLKVMDNTAFALCQREKVPIIVFNVNRLDNIEKIINGEKIGTLIS